MIVRVVLRTRNLFRKAVDCKVLFGVNAEVSFMSPNRYFNIPVRNLLLQIN